MEQTEPLTYRELVQRVIDRYRADGFVPTPSFEGAGVDREVLGKRVVRDHAFIIEAQRSADTWLLAGGSIHGLTQGSILEVLPPAGSVRGAMPLVQMRVVEVHPTSALARAIPYEGKPTPTGAAVAVGSRARVRYHEFGALQLGVALEPPLGLAAVERALNAVETLSQGLAARASSRDANWFVRVEANRVILTPGDGQAGVASSTDVAAGQVRKRFDVGALDDTALAFSLADRLRRIARAANLARLSSYVDPEAALKIQVLRYQTDAVTATPLLANGGAPAVRAGERLQFIVRNTGTLPLDVTLLYIDANSGIWPLFPLTDRELDNRIDPGRDRALEPVEITADPLGWESVIAIGVESTPRHENFRQLAQESLPDGRGPSAGPPSAFRTLLESAVSGTRSVPVRGAEDRGRFAITQTWFRVDLATIVR